jgi:hypothetical protein
MEKRMLESDSRMKHLLGNNPLGELVRILKDIWLGFKIAEENRHKSQWGKF